VPLPRILIVDDEENMRFTLSEILKHEECLIDTADNGFKALEKIRQVPFDVIILDLKMPKMDGMETLLQIREISPNSVVLMVTAHGNREKAYQALNAGAYDFFNKPFDINEMRVVVRRAIEKSRLTRELEALQRPELSFSNLVGQSPRMQEVFRLIKQVAELDVTVLVVGESGTGKELVSQAIHFSSKRAQKPFVKMNCVAIPEGLLESELFGHERGAFTGATDRHVGKFEQAQGGTILLDEIGDMALSTQAKLLRILQEREFERVGGRQAIKVDIRVVAATNQDLVKAVNEKRFREDLYFRLNVIPIFIPPLRERPGDITLLLDHFLKIYNKKFHKTVSRVSPEVMHFLNTYTWPGNVREFENFIQRSVALASTDVLTEDLLPVGLPTQSINNVRTNNELDIEPGSSLSNHITNMTAETEKRLIMKALQDCHGNRTATAKQLGLSRKGLYDKLTKYQLMDY